MHKISNRKKLKFISLCSDTTFKYLIKNDKTRPWFRNLIYNLTSIDINNYNIGDIELNTGNNIKDYRLDIRMTNGKLNTLIIELNSNKTYEKSIETENYQYLYREEGLSYNSGDKYFENKISKLICFNNYRNPHIKDAPMINYYMYNEKYKLKLNDLEIFNIYIPVYNQLCYNDNRLVRKVRMLGAKSDKELRKLASDKEDYILLKELEELKMNEAFVNSYNYEDVQKKLFNTIKRDNKEKGIQEGKLKRNREVVRNMLNENMNIELISKVTNLSIDEINKIINKEKITK